MKRIIILSAAAIAFSFTVHAQDETALRKEVKATKSEAKKERKALRNLVGKEVSYQAKQQFIADFGNAPAISADRTDNFDEFTFIKDGISTRAYYDADANLVGTVQTKVSADLPAKAQREIGKMYKDYKVVDVIFFDDNNFNETDMRLYNNQFDDEDSYFAELQKNDKKIVVHVNMAGDVEFFTTLR